MTTEIIMSYQKPETPTGEQFQEMLDRFRLGDLIAFEPIPVGSEQNVFVSSSMGEYVFRGKPLFPGQFAEEKFVVDHLHSRTKAPVAFPYLIDRSDDIFGWPYALMTRMPGVQVDDLNVRTGLAGWEHKEIASAFGKNLVDLHGFQVDHAGEYDVKMNDVRPFDVPYVDWLFDQVRYWLNDAKQYSRITPDDEKWVEQTLEQSLQAFEVPFQPCFVMGDYHLGNAVFMNGGTSWEVSGVFDFSKCYFGDPEADLSLPIALYLEAGTEEPARRFLCVYRDHTSRREGFSKRFSVHMLHERVLSWGLAKATGTETWPFELSFRDWAKPFCDWRLNW